MTRTLEIATTIRNQILTLCGPMVVGSWGANSFTALCEGEGVLGGLSFKVNGRLHKGLVKVSLTPADMYRVEFINRRSRTVKVIEEVFAEDLGHFIDQTVEAGEAA